MLRNEGRFEDENLDKAAAAGVLLGEVDTADVGLLGDSSWLIPSAMFRATPPGSCRTWPGTEDALTTSDDEGCAWCKWIDEQNYMQYTHLLQNTKL